MSWICDFCVELMIWWSHHLPISYGAINVLMFIIIQPLMILFFFGSSVAIYLAKKTRCQKNNYYRFFSGFCFSSCHRNFVSGCSCNWNCDGCVI